MAISPTQGCSNAFSCVQELGGAQNPRKKVCPLEGWARHDAYLSRVSPVGYVTTEHKLEPLSKPVKSSEKGRRERKRARASCPLHSTVDPQ